MSTEILVACVPPEKYNVPFSSFNRVNGLSKICRAKCQLDFIMIIRNENPSDIEPITQLTIAAFKNCKYGNHTEQFIILALRAPHRIHRRYAKENPQKCHCEGANTYLPKGSDCGSLNRYS